MNYFIKPLSKSQILILGLSRAYPLKKLRSFRISALIAHIFIVFFSSSLFAETGVLTRTWGNTYLLFNGGNNILYRADGTSGFQRNLYVKAVRGGTDLKLSDELGATGDVASFQISADESTVVYAGSKNSFPSPIELYSVPIEGGQAVKLNINLTPPNRIASYKITPDSAHVIYSVLQPNFVSKQLYKVPIGGGTSLPLGVASETIRIGNITPDSAYSVFAGGPILSDVYADNLFRIDLTDGSVEQLNDDFVDEGFVDFPIVSPDGQIVVYDAITTSPTFQQDFYSVQISGGNPVKLNPPFVAGGALYNKFIGPKGQYVYYVADQVVDNQNRLFRVPIGGGPSEELISNFTAGESLSGSGSTRISSDGLYAVFEINLSSPIRHLYSVSLQTGVAVKLNTGGRVLKFSISDDDNFVIFDDDSETTEVFELYSVPIEGGTATKISSDYLSFANTGSGINYDISPDSKRVAFWMDIEGDFKNEILEVPISGGQSKKLSPNLPDGSDVGFPQYSNDGSLVLFEIHEYEGVFHGIYAYDFKEEEDQDVDSELCFPVFVKSGGVAVICL